MSIRSLAYTVFETLWYLQFQLSDSSRAAAHWIVFAVLPGGYAQDRFELVFGSAHRASARLNPAPPFPWGDIFSDLRGGEGNLKEHHDGALSVLVPSCEPKWDKTNKKTRRCLL